MVALAMGSANDAVRLAYLDKEEQELIGSLDLGCLTEFKRNANGTVEVKLADRAAVLARVLDQLRDEEESHAAAFLQALDKLEEKSAPPKEVCSRR
jgi:hypothetical protein